MKYEKTLTVKKEKQKEEVCYYVKEKPDSDFGCVMYNVGIRKGTLRREIDDFSPSRKEAEELCNYLYEQTVSPDNLFLVAEEFIVTK